MSDARRAARLGLGTRLAYGFGAVAYGVKDSGFNYFLLIFYSQVIGLEARLVGLALTIALLFDALSDPLVGYWSDHLRSRWGRRHPFMYAAALPVALSYFLLWNPPAGWGQWQLFGYVLGLSVAIRLLITFYEIPSSALTAELTADYDARAALISFRYFFGWSGGNLMSVIMFLVVFPAFATIAIRNGQFNRDAYALYGQIASVLIFISIMVSALGTHAAIPQLRRILPAPRQGLAHMLREVWLTLADRSFAALFGAAVLGAIATGMAAALSFYFSTYFWGFSPQQIGALVLGIFVSAAIGSVLAPLVSRRFGKKRGAMLVGLIAFLGSPLPIVLRLFDLLPGNDDPFIFWFVLVTGTLDVGLVICFQILSSAMIADLAEQAELRTGRRSEGLLFSSIAFIRKSVQGFGLIAASFVLTLAAFPVGAQPGEVEAGAIWRLGAYYVPTILALWMGMIAVISLYRLSRADHERNLRELATGRAAAGDAAPDTIRGERMT